MSTTDRFPEAMKAGLTAFARAYVDVMDGKTDTPQPGSAASMRIVLDEVQAINDIEQRGATQYDMRVITKKAGMSPMGAAGYYAANLLELRNDGRWITDNGRNRLKKLNG